MPNNSIKLSIIVPMYKVAPYVERSLRSLTNQDIPFEDYEIICVNDGSPDNCAEIVTNLQKEIPNIILINQENQGVSMARNNALAIAKGKYMMPIDPDDYVVPNCFKSALDQADENNLDVLYCSFEIFDLKQQSIWRTDYSSLVDRVDNGYNGYFALRGPKVKDPDRSVAILYKMDLLKKFQIEYPKDVPFLEDGLFLGKVFAVAERVGYCNRDFYQRTTRPGSATNSDLFNSRNAITGFLLAIHNIKEFECLNLSTQFQKKLVNHLVAKFVLLSISSSIIRFNLNDYFWILKKIKQLGIIKVDIDGVKYNYRKLMILFNISNFFFPISYHVVNRFFRNDF